MSITEKLAKRKLQKGISKLNQPQKLAFLLDSLERLSLTQLDKVEYYILTYPDSDDKTKILNKIRELKGK